MSRAIPANFSEYLLDQTSQNTGIICDGGIMPLRNNPSHTSIWYKNCLRGEDIMFLKEAVAARRNDSSNSGLDNRQIKSSRLQQLKQYTGYLINNGLWSESDPSSNYGFYDFGSSSPSINDVYQYVKGLLPTLTQNSANDIYTILDSEPIMNLFRDVKQLNYYVPISTTSYSYNGLYRTNNCTSHTVTVRGYTDGTTRTTTSDHSSTSIWTQYRRLNHIYGEGYPSNVNLDEKTDTTNSSITFTEPSTTYRRFHRYLEVKPFGVFQLFNDYNASWQNGTGSQAVTDSDSWTTYKYILAPYPVTSYIDLLNTTSFTVSNWSSFIPAIYNFAGMEMYADNITGRFQTGSYSDSKVQSTQLNLTVYTFFVMHFLYCNLEDVTIQA